MRTPTPRRFPPSFACALPRSIALVSCFAGLVLTMATLSARTAMLLPQDPALSPDGKTLVFSWRGDLWSVASAGGVARPLTQHPGRDTAPTFSPDGRQLAFLSDRQAGPQVHLMPAAGGVPAQLTAHSEGYTLEGWYPDGAALLVNADRDYSHYPRSGLRFFRLPVGGPAGEWPLFDDFGRTGDLSPDGQRLLFTREGEQWFRKGYRGPQASQIWLHDAATGKFTPLIADDTSARSPKWRPDGKGFYFVSGRSGSFNLWEYDLAGGRRTQLTRFDNDAVMMPTVSRDGTTIVFRHLFDLYRLDVGKGQPPVRLQLWDESDPKSAATERRTLASATEVAFSDDGLEVAFIAGGDLWVMDTVLREPRQITRTPEEEREPIFAPDGGSILFVSDQGGQSDVWRAQRARPNDNWWRNDRFTLTRLTNDAEVESDLQWSPNGKRLALVKGTGDLWTIEPGTDQAQLVRKSWNRPQYQWSPDGNWFAAALNDADFNSDIWLFRSDGTGEAVNISRHPDNESNPAWSPDGRAIAFTGRRVETEVDIYYVWLRNEDETRDRRDRTMTKAVEKMTKARKQEPPRTEKKDTGSGAEPVRAEGDADGRPTKAGIRPVAVRRPARVPEVRIDFERIHERVHRISIPNSAERELLWSPDAKKLAFSATVDGRRGTYTVDFPDDLKPKLLSTETGAQGRWLESGNQIVWRMNPARPASASPAAPGTPPATPPEPETPAPPAVGGVPGSLSDAGRATGYPFRVAHETDLAGKHRAAFDLAWSAMRDSWYDERLGNRNWDEIRRKYLDAATTPDANTLATVINLMLGELNGSHLAFTPRPASTEASPTWSPITPHLGLRWDPAHRGPGLKVRDVIAGGPADRGAKGVAAGEIVVSIEGSPIDATTDLARVLNGPASRDDVRLVVRDAAEKERSVLVRPARYAAIRSLLYPQWVRENRAAVEAWSEGKLGYLHVRAMSQESFLQFEQDLYAAGVGKEGLIIDVRDNGGGSTADHLLTALTQPVHAITVPRGGTPGYPQDRKVYATWPKPVTVLCNQNSFSNAEIFSHAIKTLKRGQLVGVTTAGGVISTGARGIMDLGTLRMPGRGWFLLGTGEDLEMNGAVPDHLVWPQPGSLAPRDDAQLKKAVEVLRADVEAAKRKPAPTLRKATERK
jgi:tricorn protease